MILLGIDPGTAATGYGIVNIADPSNLLAINYGNIKTSKDQLMPERLLKIYNSARYLVDKFKPDALVIERLFFNTNAKTAISVGQARGLFILIAGEYKLPVFEYTALEAKMELTGYGRAQKEEVRQKVADMLSIKIAIKPIDASDALAMALCHSIKMTKNGK